MAAEPEHTYFSCWATGVEGCARARPSHSMFGGIHLDWEEIVVSAASVWEGSSMPWLILFLGIC